MKNTQGHLLVLFIAFTLFQTIRAEEFCYTVDFDPIDVTLSATDSGETVVSLKDGEFGEGNPGKPWLPYKVFSVRLPAGEVLRASSVEVGETVLLAENVVPVPEQLPVPTSAKPGEYPPVRRRRASRRRSTAAPTARADAMRPTPARPAIPLRLTRVTADVVRVTASRAARAAAALSSCASWR